MDEIRTVSSRNGGFAMSKLRLKGTRLTLSKHSRPDLFTSLHVDEA